MNIDELLKRILFLVPNGKFSIWENIEGQYGGQNNPVLLSGFLVDWNPASGAAPTQEQVDGVNLNAANQQAEVRRKIGRNLRLRSELPIKAAFRIEKRANPELTFPDFLDQIESENIP